MKRCAVLTVAVLLILLLLSSAALAADYYITGITGTLSIPAGTHTITGTSANLAITCAPGVTLTLNDVSVGSTGCALAFTGAGNEIILAPGTTNTFTSSDSSAGISVPASTVLAIGGSGTLNATGGTYGAGIGGGYYSNVGTVSISGGTVNATGGECGAGIGSGYSASGGTINITGGTVNATGGADSAGIGEGFQGTGVTVNITGGTVNATGGTYGAGIGTGAGGSDGTVNISGGTVSATGNLGGAGIGTGDSGTGGTINISGGKVYAVRGNESAQDIGAGIRGSGVTFTLSDSAAVFLENDSYVAPTILGTQTHYNPVPFEGNSAHGIAVPASWTSAQGAFLPPMLLPQTGDSSMGLWIALAGTAGSAITLLILVKRRRRAA